MSRGLSDLMRWLETPRTRMIAAMVAVTVVTVGIIGVAVLTLTPAGCSVAKAAGAKGANCVAGRPVAALPTPTRLITPTTKPTSSSSSPTGPTSSAASPPYNPPASVPYYPPASVPYYPPASFSQPDNFPGSNAYPFYAPASTGGSPYAARLSCSLPVYAGPPGSGGFITFPSGDFIPDPKSNVTLPTPPGPTPPPQMGYSQSGLSYDRAYARWLPVDFRSVAPDGAHYAFIYGGTAYAVAVSSESLAAMTSGGSWRIVGVQNEGVYVEPVNAPGLWLSPYAGGAFKQLASDGYWQAVSGGFAYGTLTSAVPQGATSTLIKFELATGTKTDWFSLSGVQPQVMGFDAKSNPIIYVYGSWGSAILDVSAPTAPTVIMLSAGGFSAQGFPIADKNGVWISGYSQYANGSVIALWIANSGLYGMARYGATLAGTCS